ncbi:MAG: hypothetical protein ABSC10_09515 [Candidatus Acidiferrales bacterium]|jgi:hypothetical protein
MSSASARPPAAIPPQRRSNNAVWWILGIVAGGIVVMVLFGLALAGLFIRNLRVHNQGNNVEIQTPVGAIKVNKDVPRATGLPVYPGATSSGNDKNAKVELSAGDGGVGIAVEHFSTIDNLDQVDKWYLHRLGPSFRREQDLSRHPIHGVTVDSDTDIAFVDDHGDGARVVALTKKGEGVDIVLFRAGKKEAQ